MVIDTSALAAIFFNEPERIEFLGKIEGAVSRSVSASSLVEALMVVRRDLGADGAEALLSFLDLSEIVTVPFSHEQALLASEAFRRFGKRRHRANLNLGDCFSYALAKHLGEPLLCKGDDFTHTDLLLA
jgi:ribonuclease VapC